MTTATKTPDTDEFEAELDAAKARRDDVLRRIGEGDPKVSAKMLADVEHEVELASLRVTAAEERAAEVAEGQRLAEIDALANDIEAIHDGDTRARLASRLQTFVEATDALLDEWQEQYDTVEAIRQRLTKLGPLPHRMKQHTGHRFTYKGREIHPTPPHKLIGAALHHLFRSRDIKPGSELEGPLHRVANDGNRKAGQFGIVMERYATDDTRKLLEGRAGR